MTSALTVANQASLPIGAGLRGMPALVVVEGERTVWRYVEFFIANIRNPNGTGARLEVRRRLPLAGKGRRLGGISVRSRNRACHY